MEGRCATQQYYRHRNGTVFLGQWVPEQRLITFFSASTFLAMFFLRRPMIPLTIGVAILDKHT